MNLFIMNATSSNYALELNRTTAFNRISSGKRINSSKDDAAGMSISTKMQSQIRGLYQANRNIQDGISLLQLSDSAMSEIHSILDREIELCTQAASDTCTDTDRAIIQNEVLALRKELSRIYNDTEFNGIKVLQGSTTRVVTITDLVSEIVTTTEEKFEVTGKLPNWITDPAISNSSSMGLLESNGITFNETFYNKTNVKITREVNGVIEEVNSFKSNSGILYSVGTTTVDTSAPDSLYGTLKLTGEDGYVYTIHRTYDPFNNLQTHAGSFIDFSGLDKGNSISSLIGTGFQTTCCSCEKRYSIRFTDSPSSVETNGSHYIYNVDVSGVSSSTELLDRIMNTLSPTGKTVTRTDDSGKEWTIITPQNHFTGYAIEKDDLGNPTGRLLVYDYPTATYNRRPNVSKDWGIFDSGVYTKITVTNTSIVTSEKDTSYTINGSSLNLQLGANNGQFLSIELADMGLDKLLLNGSISITSHSDAIQLLDSLINAKDYVSSERSRLGAIHNRLEHSSKIVTTTELNLTSSNSRILDSDMAKELMNLTKHKLLMNISQSIQAHSITNRKQYILNLLS